MGENETDNCVFCLGRKGGVPGNENIVGGLIVCDHCHSLLLSLRPSSAAVEQERDALRDVLQEAREHVRNLLGNLREANIISDEMIRADLWCK